MFIAPTASKNEVIAGQYSQTRAGVDATREHVEAIREEVRLCIRECCVCLAGGRLVALAARMTSEGHRHISVVIGKERVPHRHLGPGVGGS